MTTGGRNLSIQRSSLALDVNGLLDLSLVFSCLSDEDYEMLWKALEKACGQVVLEL